MAATKFGRRSQDGARFSRYIHRNVGLVDILFVLVVDLAPRPLFVVVAVPVDKHDRVCLVRLGA
jgi:hypothetical protein